MVLLSDSSLLTLRVSEVKQVVCSLEGICSHLYFLRNVCATFIDKPCYWVSMDIWCRARGCGYLFRDPPQIQQMKPGLRIRMFLGKKDGSVSVFGEKKLDPDPFFLSKVWSGSIFFVLLVYFLFSLFLYISVKVKNSLSLSASLCFFLFPCFILSLILFSMF